MNFDEMNWDDNLKLHKKSKLDSDMLLYLNFL